MAKNDTRTLTVALVAKSQLFKRGLNDASKHLRGFKSSVSGIMGDLGSITRKMAIGFGATAAAASAAGTIIFNSTRNSIDELAKMAQRIGATTQEMQVLHRIAELDGIGIEAMNSNLMRMNKVLGEASLGLGGAGKVLEQFGLDAKQLIQLPVSERVAQIAEAIAKIPNQAQRAALATALFGRSGVTMLVALQKGRDVVDDMFSEMEGTGELFSAEDASRVEEMNDAMTRLWGVFGAFSNQIVIKVAPAITELIERTQEWVMSFGGAGEIINMVVESYIVPAMNHIGERIAWVGKGIQLLVAVWETLKAAALTVAALISAGFEFNLRIIKVVSLGIARAFLNMVNMIAKAIDFFIDKAQAIGEKVGIDLGIDFSAQEKLKPLLDEVVRMSKDANKEIATSVFDDPFVDSLRKEATAANQKAADAWSNFMDPSKNEFKQSAEGIRDYIADIFSGVREQTQQAATALPQELLDMVDGLEDAEKISSSMKDNLDGAAKSQDEIKKSSGQFTTVRSLAEVSSVGSVVSRTGGTGDSGAAQFAAKSGNEMTGAENTTGLLQGILMATQATAQNTARGLVPVAG